MPHFGPRKQPRQARSSDTVEVILESAARILETEGLERVTTNRVAENAGVSVGSLYQYFPNKQSILAELVRREQRVLLADVTALCSDVDRHGIEEFTRRLVKIGMKHQFGRLRLASELEHVEAVLPLQKGAQDLTNQIIVRIGEALEQMAPHADDRTARDIVAICQGMADMASTAGETDLQSIEDRILKAVFGYLDTAAVRADT